MSAASKSSTIILSTLALSALLAGIGYMEGDIVDQFGEGKPGTIASVLLLLALSYVSFKIYRARRDRSVHWLRETCFVWLVIAGGFFFLAMDDALKFHEGMDKAFHSSLDVKETALSDRLDDLIVGIYILIGAGVIYLYRAEFRRYPFLKGYLVIGFAIVILQTILDVASNDVLVFTWLGVPEQNAVFAKDIVRMLEEVAKLMAEAVFLSGFLEVLRAVRAE